MLGRTELAHSRYLIHRTKARIAHQRRLAASLCYAPHLAVVAGMMVLRLEERLLSINKTHDRLLLRLKNELALLNLEA